VKALIIASGNSINQTSVVDYVSRNPSKDLAILVTDRSLAFVLSRGITPPKFPKFYTCIQENLITQAGEDLMPGFLYHNIIFKNAKNITLFYSQLLKENRVQIIHDLAFKAVKFNRCGKGPGAGPVIRTCGNNGVALLQIARRFLMFDKIGFIGLDLDESTSWISYAGTPIVDNMLKFSKAQIVEDFLEFNKSYYSLTRLGRLHGKGIKETIISEFLGK